MIDMTARTRDRLLREHAEAHGLTVDDAAPVDEPTGIDFTGRLARELRARREGEDYDETWLHMYGQPQITKTNQG
jgi:hypothetical protein